MKCLRMQKCYFQKDIVDICMNSVQELTTNLADNPYNQMINPCTDQKINL